MAEVDTTPAPDLNTLEVDPAKGERFQVGGQVWLGWGQVLQCHISHSHTL